MDWRKAAFAALLAVLVGVSALPLAAGPSWSIDFFGWDATLSIRTEGDRFRDALQAYGDWIEGWFAGYTTGPDWTSHENAHFEREVLVANGGIWAITDYIDYSFGNGGTVTAHAYGTEFALLDQAGRVWAADESVWGPKGMNFNAGGLRGFTQVIASGEEITVEIFAGRYNDDGTGYEAGAWAVLTGRDGAAALRAGQVGVGSGISCQPAGFGSIYWPKYDEWGLAGKAVGEGTLVLRVWEEDGVYRDFLMVHENVRTEGYSLSADLWASTGRISQEFSWEEFLDLVGTYLGG